MTDPAPSSWYCDACGELINDPDLGLVLSKIDRETGRHAFRVVHKSIKPHTCDPGPGEYDESVEISAYLGPDGVASLLAELSGGPLAPSLPAGLRVADLDGFVDVFRRMQTPYYEEARRRFKDPSVRHALAGMGPIIYTAAYLRRIADDEWSSEPDLYE
jgi:hypothetical protein